MIHLHPALQTNAFTSADWEVKGQLNHFKATQMRYFIDMNITDFDHLNGLLIIVSSQLEAIMNMTKHICSIRITLHLRSTQSSGIRRENFLLLVQMT